MSTAHSRATATSPAPHPLGAGHCVLTLARAAIHCKSTSTHVSIEVQAAGGTICPSGVSLCGAYHAMHPRPRPSPMGPHPRSTSCPEVPLHATCPSLRRRPEAGSLRSARRKRRRTRRPTPRALSTQMLVASGLRTARTLARRSRQRPAPPTPATMRVAHATGAGAAAAAIRQRRRRPAAPPPGQSQTFLTSVRTSRSLAANCTNSSNEMNVESAEPWTHFERDSS